MCSDLARAMRALLVISIAGCGRFGFDPATSGDGAVGDDGAGDGDGEMCVAAAEICDGVDNDCDLEIDEGCPCVPFAVQRTGPVTLIDEPLIAWIGTGYIVGYARSNTLFLEKVGADGGAIGAPKSIGTSTYANRGAMTFTGERILVAWGEANGDRLGAFAIDGTRIGTDRTLETPIDEGPYFAWNGSFAGLAFHEVPGNNQRLQRYSAMGDYGGGTSFGTGMPIQDLAWHGAGFVMSAREGTNPRAVMMTTFDPGGQFIALGINVSGNRVGFVEGRTTGFANVLGSAWLDSAGVSIVPHDVAGTATAAASLVETVGLNTNRTVGLAWSGTSYLVATTTDLLGSHLVRLFPRTAAGGPAGSVEQFPPAQPVLPLTIGRPTIRTASAGRVVIAWTQTALTTELWIVQRCL